MSADGKTTLVGYVFKPNHAKEKRVPAVVMMHGRAGAYSSLANGVYDASTLTKRHKFWGETLAQNGYIAILVDGFGPRGYPHGFAAHSYEQRPPELDEVNIRPLDAMERSHICVRDRTSSLMPLRCSAGRMGEARL